MSLHNFNPNNKSWKMYSNTITSISGDNLTIKPYDGKNLLLEVSGNNNIFFKKGDISYGLDDLIGGGNSNSDFSATDITTSLIPTNTNSIDLGSSSKYLKNAYVRDISLTNMTASGSVVPIVPELVRPALPVGGTVIALNSTGTIVATNIQYISGIGRVRVYEFTNNTWIQVGQDVSMGTTEYTNFGYSIGLNGDGTILAVGAPDKSDSVNALDMAGCVTVYKYTTSWDILGQFYGESAYAMFGSNISLNDSGTVIAIGSRGDQPPNYPYGVVKVYKYINNNWTNIGSINGLIWVSRNGEGLSLNGDGTILAISTSNINQYVWNSPKNGFVNVYRYISGTTWQPYGQQINGTQADEMFGYSISLNYNGNIVAIGSPLYDVSSVSINTGRVLIYKYSDITWELLGNIFNGYAAGDFFGISVSLNAAGNVLAIGVPYYDVGTTTVSNHSHGRVLLYNYNNGWGTPIIINGSPAQRGAGWFVALNRSGTVLGYCQVFDNNGIDAPTNYPVTFYINQIANNEGGSIGKNETRWSTSYITNMYSDTIRPMNNGSGSLGASDSVFDIAYLNTLSASKIIASTIRTSNIIATNRVYEINTTSMTWENHNANAMSQGKTLASILNATENQQVIALLLSNNISRAFIGGIRTYNSNTTGQTLSDWRWINGDNWSYTNFMPNQPDQQQERFLEYYTASIGSITHQWNDVNSIGDYGFSSAAVYMSNVDINLLTFVSGATSNIQAQLNGLSTNKANSVSPSFSGTITIPSGVSILSNSVSVTSAQLAFVSGATSNIQTQLTSLSNNKANSASPSFSGTITIPSGVSILSNSVSVTSAQLAFVSGATSNIQTQLNNKVSSASPTFTGTITTDIIRNNNTSAIFSKITSTVISNIWALSFSNDGSIYAVVTNSGVVSVYRIAENNSNAILGTNGSFTSSDGVNFGYSVAISGDGTIVAIGTRAANSSRGNVVVYKYNGTSWALLGSNQSTILIGRISGANFGETVYLSQTGTILCVSSMNVQEINVYQYNVVSNLWSQIGNIITGGGDGQAGRNVALSSDGLTVAMGATDFNTSRGRVRIFRLNSITQTTWDLIGTITGTIAGNDWNSGERVGASMSFSSDGNIIAVAAHGPATPYVVSPYTASNQGSVTVYRYSSTTSTWIQYGQTLYGVSANAGGTGGDTSLGIVSINNNGTVLSIVSNLANVRVFTFNGNFWNNPVITLTGTGIRHKLSGNGSRLLYNVGGAELSVYESSSIGSINSVWYNNYAQNLYSTYINPQRIEYTPTTGTGAQIVFSDALYRYNVFTSSGNYTPGANRPVTVLIVGGGGGGGGFLGGGGGGGGVVYLPSINVYAGQTYPVVVGGGGPSNTNGQQSSFFGAIAAGGGGGGGSYPSGSGFGGGCGGGAAANNNNSGQGYNSGGQSGGNSLGIHSGFIYGNSAGNLYRHRTGDPTRGSGGGGAGFPSRDTDPNTAGDPTRTGEGSGGEGVINNILGPSFYWGGGGGGGSWNYQIGGWGGLGGGGGGAGVGGGGTGGGSAYNGNSGANGGNGYNSTGGAGGANTGGGGGASTTGGDNVNTGGGSGGSGIVIIREALVVTTNNDTLGSPTMSWNNAYINNLNVNSINGTKHVNMLVFHSEQTIVQTHNALSIITHYLNIYVNYLTLTDNFSANASLTLKLPGTYMFDIWSWVCGAGTGGIMVEAYRNGTLVYARRRATSSNNCGTAPTTLLWNKFLTGDVIKLYKNTNNGGRIINGVVQPIEDDIVGPVSIWYLGDI